MSNRVGGERVRRILMIFMVLIFVVPNKLWAESKNYVEAYYFHGTARCASCHKIEQYTEEAIKEGFSKELDSGELIYKVVNVENEGNRHFIDEYQLYTKAVVLSLVRDGKEVEYNNLSEVWQYLHDKEKFCDYIKNETHIFLDAEYQEDI